MLCVKAQNNYRAVLGMTHSDRIGQQNKSTYRNKEIY